MLSHFQGLRFGVLTAVKMSRWSSGLCCLVVLYIVTKISEECNPEDEGDTFLQNIGNHLEEHMGHNPEGHHDIFGDPKYHTHSVSF
jgi:hypothetical protein